MDISVLTSVPPGYSARPPTTGNVAPEDGKALPQTPVATPVSSGTSDTGNAAKVSREESLHLVGQNEQDQEPPSVELAEKAVERLNEVLKDRARELQFSVDDASGRTIVKVIHAESGEVIRQMPPEVVLRFADAFTEGSASLLEDFA